MEKTAAEATRDLQHHKHTDECLRYAAETGRPFCIAPCADSRRGSVEIERKAIEELVEYLSKKQTTGGQFPMETWRAEADGVDHLLVALKEALE